VVTEALAMAALEQMAASGFGDMVKAVVDIERRIMALGGDLHAETGRPSCSIKAAIRNTSGASTCTPRGTARRAGSNSTR